MTEADTLLSSLGQSGKMYWAVLLLHADDCHPHNRQRHPLLSLGA
jgi:hypothetical protein